MNCLRLFFRSTQAGATAMVAVAATVMTVGAAAVIVDHSVLVDQRDTLKSASAAASIATTQEMSRLLSNDPDITDDALQSALEPLARRYITLNLGYLSRERYTRAVNTLVVELAIDRSGPTVDVDASADMGGVLISRLVPLLEGVSVPSRTSVTTQAVTITSPIEVVLAIDVSESMNREVDTNTECEGCENNRMSVVKRAALDLVNVLTPDADNRIAIGVVPWHSFVRLDATTAATWEENDWVRYPTRRVYPQPYHCAQIECVPHAIYGQWCSETECSTQPAAVEQAVAAVAPESWNGCLNSDRTGSVDTRAALSLDSTGFFTLPSSLPFAQAFFPAIRGSSYECLSPPFPDGYLWQHCFSGTKYWSADSTGEPLDAKFQCADTNPAILPLSTDTDTVRAAINALSPIGNNTYSALGVLWAQRLLNASWNKTWDGGVHPVDPTADDSVGLRKAIVLLTDGEDTHCGFGNDGCVNSRVGISRSDACDAVKEAGTEIFVVSAMHPDLVSDGLAASLTACSSKDDNPDGTYVFLNNATAEDLEAAFADIASQVHSVRRVY